MTFLNKLKSARIGKIFARWHLALAITSIYCSYSGALAREARLRSTMGK